MKKIIKIAAITLIALFLIIIAIPFLFKGQIIESIKTTVNEQLNAKVDFGDFDLSIISTFPNLKFSIEKVSVDGTAEFEGIQLASIQKITLVIDLMSVISGDQYKIKKIIIDQPSIHARILENGKANWDIAKPDTTTTEPTEDTTETKFSLALKELRINHANILYEDFEGNMVAEINQLNYTLSGDFTEKTTHLDMLLSVDSLSYKMEGIPYLNKAKTEFKATLLADLEHSRYTFKENVFRLNALELSFDGWLAMPNDSLMEMDLTFKAARTSFKEILSLIPAIYKKDFAQVKTAGNLELHGFAKGTYTDSHLPAFETVLKVTNAMFKYPDLPKSVDNIAIDLKISNPGGNEDLTVIDLKKLHFEMAQNPFDVTLLLTTPISDPNIQSTMIGKIDLDKLKEVIPLEKEEKLSGLIESDLKIAGRMSSLEKEKYEEFQADGNLSIQNLSYFSPSLGYDVAIKEMKMAFSPQKVDLVNFHSIVGKSDFRASGTLDNIIQYALKDSVTLKGRFTFTSDFLDANQFMTEDSAATTSTADTASDELTVFEVPEFIDFTLQSSIRKLLYDNYEITNLQGLIVMKDQKISMQNVSMNLMEGTVKMSGYYETTNPKEPTYDFQMAIQQFDVQKTVTTFNTVEKLAPIARSCFGKFSSELSVSGKLNDKMEPILNSLSGTGKLLTHNIAIKDFKPIVKVAEAIKKPEYGAWTLNDVNISFAFKEGKVEVQPFKFKLGKTEVTTSGYNTFEQEISYEMNFAIPRAELGSQANEWAQNLTGKTGVEIKLPDIINIKAKITGTVTDPKISTDLKALGGNIKEQVKEAIKEKVEEKIEEVKEDVKQKVKEEAAKIIAEAEKQAAQIRQEAQSLADKTRKEGYAAADELENKAKNPLEKAAAKKAADKMRKETDEKAQKIINEGNAKADNIINEARKKAAEIENK